MKMGGQVVRTPPGPRRVPDEAPAGGGQGAEVGDGPRHCSGVLQQGGCPGGGGLGPGFAVGA